MLLVGSEDSFSSAELIRAAVAPRFADVRTVHVAGAGHWPHVEQPAAVAQILTRFLASLRPEDTQQPYATPTARRKD